MSNHLPEAMRCPVCGARPDVGTCDPWPKDAGEVPWYANCYSTAPAEHCIGGNGDTMREAIEIWNKSVMHYRASVGPRQTPVDK